MRHRRLRRGLRHAYHCCEGRPQGLDARVLRDEFSATLATLTGCSEQLRYTVDDFLSPRGCFLLARAPRGEALGFGAFRRHAYGVAEICEFYVRPNALGVGLSILQGLETRAMVAGYRQLILETRAANRRAVRFCERHGFREVNTVSSLSSRPRDARCFLKQVA